MRVAFLLVIHVFGLVLWICGLLGNTLILSQLAGEVSTEARQSLERLQRIFLRALADPGAFTALAAGIATAFTNAPYYFHAIWLQIKLAFVVILIVLHVMIAMAGKSAGKGRTVNAGQVRILRLLLILVFFSILVVTFPGQAFLR